MSVNDVQVEDRAALARGFVAERLANLPSVRAPFAPELVGGAVAGGVLGAYLGGAPAAMAGFFIGAALAGLTSQLADRFA